MVRVRHGGLGTGLDAGPINDIGDAHQNLIQFYTVTRKDLATGAQTNLTPGKIMFVPPPNVKGQATIQIVPGTEPMP